MEIGERIRWLRKQRNMTIETLGRKVGVTRQTISRYETGAIEEIPMEKLETISSCFDVDISYLMGLSIDSQIDSLNFDIQKARSALDNVSDQESREELEQEIFVLNESLDDLCLAKNLSDSASTTKGLRSKSDNVYTPFTVGRHVKEWHSDKKGVITMRIDSWLFWALKGFAAEKKCSLDDAVESILYDRIQEEIENSDEFQHGGE